MGMAVIGAVPNTLFCASAALLSKLRPLRASLSPALSIPPMAVFDELVAKEAAAAAAEPLLLYVRRSLVNDTVPEANASASSGPARQSEH